MGGPDSAVTRHLMCIAIRLERSKMKYLSLCVLLVGATTVSAQTPSPKGGDKVIAEPITLTGCVAAGTEANTYMLSNVVRTDKAVGTTGTGDAPPLYWFDSPAKLKPHVGHQVEISGWLDDDVDKTKVKAKDGKVEIKAEGGRKVEVPAGTTAAAAMGTAGTKRLNYKVKVQSVKMTSESCAK
jgi:hypothetical protein